MNLSKLFMWETTVVYEENRKLKANELYEFLSAHFGAGGILPPLLMSAIGGGGGTVGGRVGGESPRKSKSSNCGGGGGGGGGGGEWLCGGEAPLMRLMPESASSFPFLDAPFPFPL